MSATTPPITTLPAATPVNALGGSSAVNNGSAADNISENQFLQLLTTQLSNQDPTAPTDESQMLAQLAQFATVQGVNNLQGTFQQQQGAALIGQTVQAQVTDSNGNAQTVSGAVTSVTYDSTGTNLTINGYSSPVNINDVTAVQ